VSAGHPFGYPPCAVKPSPVAKLSGRDLKEATRRECIRRANAAAGSPAFVDASKLRELAECIYRNTFVDDWGLDGVCADLLFAIDRAITAGEAYTHVKYVATDEHGAFLEGISKALSRLIDREAWPTKKTRSTRSSQLKTRRFLIEHFDRPREDFLPEWSGWWGDGRPTRNDLAVLSVLAGHWTDAGRDTTLTPAEAIEAEARNLDHVAKQLGRKLLASAARKPTKKSRVRSVGRSRA
jgi:hypothetical protein